MFFSSRHVSCEICPKLSVKAKFQRSYSAEMLKQRMLIQIVVNLDYGSMDYDVLQFNKLDEIRNKGQVKKNC